MAIYIVQKESLETVADSIRAKAGISEKLVFPDGWKAAVEGMQTAAPFCVVTIGSPTLFTVGGEVNITCSVEITAA